MKEYQEKSSITKTACNHDLQRNTIPVYCNIDFKDVVCGFLTFYVKRE